MIWFTVRELRLAGHLIDIGECFSLDFKTVLDKNTSHLTRCTFRCLAEFRKSLGIKRGCLVFRRSQFARNTLHRHDELLYMTAK